MHRLLRLQRGIFAATLVLAAAAALPADAEAMQRRTAEPEAPAPVEPPDFAAASGPESPDEWEAGFAERRRLLMEQIAEHYRPTEWHDRGKYSFPKALARFYIHGTEDEAGNGYIAEYARESGHGYGFFHFPFVGMSRLMKEFPEAPALAEHRDEFLDRILHDTSHYNALTAEGTENHIGMSRTSGYLFATEARDMPALADTAEDWEARIKAWALDWARKIYQVGTGEWDSAVYTTYNLIGWINLHDHSGDAEIRAAARAVLDYYAAALALKYTQRVHGGPESRGTTNYTRRSSASEYLGWLWFGQAEEAGEPDFWRTSEYIQSVYAALTDYRPPAAAVALARKEFSRPATYINTKPSYLLTRPAESVEVFHIGETYTLGSVFTPYGGWADSSYGTVNWKMVIENPSGAPGIVWGNGGMKSDSHGRGRNPFDQFAQHESVLVQMTLVPENAAALRDEVNTLINEWKEAYRRDFEQRWGNDSDHNPVGRGGQGSLDDAPHSHLFLPSDAEVIEADGVVFAAYAGTWLAVRSLAEKSPRRGEGRLSDHGTPGTLAGLVVEVGSFPAHGAFEDFRRAILDRTALDRSRLAGGRLVYTDLAGREIDVRFNTAGEWVEPDYDWNYGVTEQRVVLTTDDWNQPDWPSGEGHGRLASWSIDGVPSDLPARRAVFDGPNLTLDGGILRLRGKEATHVVDFSGTRPEFRTKPADIP
ncbi:MAG: hypothetical protein JJU00_11710 [Opitutales bacterium]|nr:hypothetical protein [Opitutales bacterium]